MHRNNMRIVRLEDMVRRQRDAKIDRIVAFALEILTPEEFELVCAAQERDKCDGDDAVFTQEELAAVWRFDSLVQRRPDILQLMADLMTPGGCYAQQTR